MTEDDFCMTHTSSIPPDDRARKATSLLLQRLAPDGTQRNLAQAWGVSESSVSRLKEQIEPVMRLMAHLGLKCVPVEQRCIDEREIEALMILARRHMQMMSSVDQFSRED